MFGLVYVCIVVVLILLLWCWYSTIEWRRLHFKSSDYVQIDNEDVEDLLEAFGKYLKPTAVMVRGDALFRQYDNMLGRSVILEVRWPNTKFYYVQEHWLDILDEPYNKPEAMKLIQ